MTTGLTSPTDQRCQSENYGNWQVGLIKTIISDFHQVRSDYLSKLKPDSCFKIECLIHLILVFFLFFYLVRVFLFVLSLSYHLTFMSKIFICSKAPLVLRQCLVAMEVIDSFTVFLHGLNGCPFVCNWGCARARQWPSQNNGNSHQSHELLMHCSLHTIHWTCR